MAKGKNGPAKAAKSAAPRAAAERPAGSRRPARTAADAPSSGTVETRGSVTGNSRGELSPEDVYRLIQETAYFKAKARGFEPGGEVQDWIEAEAEVRRKLENRA
jgi:hypothetical protein